MVSLRHRFGFLRGLMSGGRARGLPLYANVDVTHRCGCAYCRWHSRLLRDAADGGLDLDLSPEAFRQFCKGARAPGRRPAVRRAGERSHPEIATLVRTAGTYRVLLYSTAPR